MREGQEAETFPGEREGGSREGGERSTMTGDSSTLERGKFLEKKRRKQPEREYRAIYLLAGKDCIIRVIVLYFKKNYELKERNKRMRGER